MIVVNIARRNVDPSQSEDLDGLHLFGVNITRDHDGTSYMGSNTSVTIRLLLLLATGPPGHIEPPNGGDWVNEHVQDMVSALRTQMNSPSDFYGERVVIRIAEQPWFNKDSSEDHNTEDHMPMQRVLWEILERLEVWEPTMRPMEVSVVQTLAIGTPQHLSQDDEGNNVADQENKIQRRVLVLSCRAPGRSTHASELSHPVSRTILQAVGDSTNVMFVRPGSFRALKTELESRPKGYFSAIHLDMLLVHKRPRKSDPGVPRIYFQFVNQNKSEVMEEDLKAVDKVAALLLLHGVQGVVIVPCPHARSAVETAATVLLNGGIQTVVTSAYHITENGIEAFIRSLYTGYIHQKLPLEEAARAARRCLRGSEGDERIPICDFVALSYVNPKWLPSTSLCVDYKSLKQEQSYPNTLHGREHDIVHIESILLLGKPLPLLIYGMAGIGKTALLDHLCTWWKASGMVEDAIHIRLSLSEPFNKDNMLLLLQSHFVPNSTVDSEDTSSLYEHFEIHKCLIVIDDLDSADFNRQQGQFMNLTSKLSKSGALVILASRKRERWLSKAKLYKLPGIQTRPATLWVMNPEFRDRVTDNDDSSSPETMAKNKTQEVKDYIEAVVEMVNGNPQAIEIMTRSGLYWSRAPKDIYCFLLGLRSNYRTAHPVKFETSGTGDLSEQRRSRTRLDDVYESLQSMDLGDGFLPILLAPFMGVLPSNDLLMIFCIWSTRVAKVLGKAASTRLVRGVLDSDAFYREHAKLTEDVYISIGTLLNATRVAEAEEDLALQLDLSNPNVLFHKDLEFSEPPSPASSFLTAMCDRVKDGLVDDGMLEEFPEVPDSLVPIDRGIMRLNPIVPLLFRQHPAYKNNSFSLQSTVNETFVLYYCYRGKKWPWDCWDDNRSWAVASAEIEIEFDNFASACMTGLLHIDLDTIHLMGLVRIAAVLEHGAGEKFYYRKTILTQVWTVALARTLTEFNKLRGEGRSCQTEIYMFLLAAMYFSSELGRFHDLDRESDEVTKYKGLIAQFAVLASKIVPKNIAVKAQREELSGKKELGRLARMAADPDQDILYSIRGQVRRVFVWISNPFETSSFVGPATTTSVSVDVELATMLSISVEVRRHMSVVDDAEEAAKRDDWAMADEALNKALRLELNATENDCTSRIGLIQLQKMVAEKRKYDERVRQLADELSKLELIVANVDKDGKVFNDYNIKKVLPL
ncbi:hypothetical protein Forpe1208_v002260 [Fusarium oxysporum f. sp. rapae]|uniref:NACHT domain-containing protein n=1 Tax=Fusarium oxysporum f. sp. rapae TaxID=485398 RepID=A0A8J5P584_FUSOX|nr:hypothetical protein Forpe1208_v002260 [Fusarium oxysporum f. sp. rapae]